MVNTDTLDTIDSHYFMILKIYSKAVKKEKNTGKADPAFTSVSSIMSEL